MMFSNALNSRGSKASGITHQRCANFRHRKKDRNGLNLKLRHALRATGVIINCPCFLKEKLFLVKFEINCLPNYTQA